MRMALHHRESGARSAPARHEQLRLVGTNGRRVSALSAEVLLANVLLVGGVLLCGPSVPVHYDGGGRPVCPSLERKPRVG